MGGRKNRCNTTSAAKHRNSNPHPPKARREYLCGKTMCRTSGRASWLLAVLCDLNFSTIQLMKVRQRKKIPKYPSWWELKESVRSIYNIYNPFFNLCNSFRFSAVGSTAREQGDKQVLGGTVRPLRLDQKVLQQSANCTRVTEKKPVETYCIWQAWSKGLWALANPSRSLLWNRNLWQYSKSTASL